jgi:adhesin/invasin
VVDEFCNPVPEVAMTWTAAAELQVASQDAKTGRDGKAAITVSATQAGSHDVAAAIPSATLAGSPQAANFKAGAPDLDGNSRVSIAPTVGTSVLADGSQSYTVTAEVFDAQGNPVARIVGFQVESGSAELSAAACETATDGAAPGVCAITVTSNAVGTAVISAAVFEGPLAGSPVSAQFSAGAPDLARSSFAIVPDSLQVDGHASATFTIRDAQGHGLPGLAPTLSAPGLTLTPEAGDWGADGNYRWDVTTKAAGVYTLTARLGSAGERLKSRLGDEAIEKSAQVTFTPGAPELGPTCVDPTGASQPASRLAIDTTEALIADGVQIHDATAYVVDAFCNPVPGVALGWTAAPELHIFAADNTTGADGTGVIRVSSLTAGSHAVSGIIQNTQTLPGSPAHANFQAAPCQEHCDTTPPPDPDSAHQDVDGDGNDVVTNMPACDAEPGSVITVTFPGGEQREVTVGQDGCWSVLIPEGTESGTATVVARDAEGNLSQTVYVDIDLQGDPTWEKPPVTPTPTPEPSQHPVVATGGVPLANQYGWIAAAVAAAGLVLLVIAVRAGRKRNE